MSGTPILETTTELEITAISAPLLNTDRVFITRGTVTYTGTMAQLITFLADSGEIAPLVAGFVPTANLPSYVDDVLEFANLAAFPVTGESGKIYIAIDTEIDYRWTGSVYVPIGQTPDVVGIGATAFPRYDVSQSLSTAQKEQLTANIGVYDPTINNQTGTAYTLQTVATDNDGKTIVRANNASANTVTVITAQTRPILVRQVGAGITTLVAGAGVTLNGNLVFSGANDSKSIVPVGGGVFDVYGGA